jgi:hypothetical protein
MKTPPANTLERTETGGYVGAVGGQGLSPEQKKMIRKILADSHEPLFLGSIAAKAGIALNTPMAQQAVSDFLGVYLTSTKEAELHFEDNRKAGREIFRGFVGTEHLRDLMSKGLC